MKRECFMCRNYYRYDKVKVVPKTGLQICNGCRDTISWIVRDDLDRYGL